MLPMEFVNKMKKDGKLIMGIGHRVKSVSVMTAYYVCIKNWMIVKLLLELSTKHKEQACSTLKNFTLGS